MERRWCRFRRWSGSRTIQPKTAWKSASKSGKEKVGRRRTPRPATETPTGYETRQARAKRCNSQSSKNYAIRKYNTLPFIEPFSTIYFFCWVPGKIRDFFAYDAFLWLRQIFVFVSEGKSKKKIEKNVSHFKKVQNVPLKEIELDITWIFNF